MGGLTLNTEMNTEVGQRLAEALYGLDRGDMDYVSSFVDTIEDDPTGGLHKQAAALAAQFYVETGQMEKFAYHLYNNLAHHVGPWSSGLRDLTMPIFRALGRNSPHAKQANLLETVVKAAPEWYEKALLASIGIGAGTGALGWQLSQDDVESDLDLARQQARLAYMNQTTEDIDDALRERGIAA